jgi:hypothetical protein
MSVPVDRTKEAVDERTTNAITCKCKALGRQIVPMAVAHNVIENAIGLLELEGKLLRRCRRVVREDDRSLSLAGNIFH